MIYTRFQSIYIYKNFELRLFCFQLIFLSLNIQISLSLSFFSQYVSFISSTFYFILFFFILPSVFFLVRPQRVLNTQSIEESNTCMNSPTACRIPQRKMETKLAGAKREVVSIERAKSVRQTHSQESKDVNHDMQDFPERKDTKQTQKVQIFHMLFLFSFFFFRM